MKVPCFKCPERGCGKQASCLKYMEFWEQCREMYKKRRQTTMLNMYTRDAIRRVTAGRLSTMDRYRQGGIHEDKS